VAPSVKLGHKERSGSVVSARRRFIELAILCIGLLVFPQIASAYTLLGGKWASITNLTWRWTGSYSALETQFSYAISDWDNTATDISFTEVSSSEKILG
jgi:hypothetical protein